MALSTNNLYERLKQQREARADATKAAVARTGNIDHPTLPAEARTALGAPWQQVASEVWRATYFDPLPDSDASPVGCGGFLFDGDPTGIRFFDTETTGLSGGAGTLVFLYASGRLLGAGLETTLLFLSDFSGEPDFLSLVAEDLGAAETLVSYNGRSFDTPLLRNRFLLNRMNPVVREHIDLLYPARRLFSRRLERCSLGAIEVSVLGVARELDVPGSEIPDRYFQFLRDRLTENLLPVFSHVRQDIVSLALLLAHAEKLLTGAGLPVDGIVDRLGLARMLVEQPYRRNPQPVDSLFRDGLEMLAEIAAEVESADSVAAAVRACAIFRRQGQIERAHRLWRLHFERRRSVWAAVELAKHYEHRERAFEAAREVTQEARAWTHAARQSEALDRRIKRLQARLNRRTQRKKAPRATVTGEEINPLD